jgi:GH24 family phage-related lysozyme (muramidase)
MATELEKLKDVVLKFEDTKKNAYIPFKNNTVIGKSGVTIGKGLDLGQQSTTSIDALKSYGLSEALAKRLREHPDLGKKFTGKTTAEATFTPMSLTAEEETELNKALIDKYKKDFYDAYETNVGRKITDDLTENQRIALTSASFNLGVKGLFKNKNGTDTNFKNQLINKDFNAAAKNLGTWSNDNLKYRRAAEAALFGNYIDTTDVDKVRDSFYSNRTADSGAGLQAFQENLQVLENGAVRPPTGAGAGRGSVNPEFNAPAGYDTITNGAMPVAYDEVPQPAPQAQPTYDYIPQQPVPYTPSAPMSDFEQPQYATMEDLLADRGLMGTRGL